MTLILKKYFLLQCIGEPHNYLQSDVMDSDSCWDSGLWQNCQALRMLNHLHLELVAKILSPVSNGSAIGLEMFNTYDKFE